MDGPPRLCAPISRHRGTDMPRKSNASASACGTRRILPAGDSNRCRAWTSRPNAPGKSEAGPFAGSIPLGEDRAESRRREVTATAGHFPFSYSPEVVTTRHRTRTRRAQATFAVPGPPDAGREREEHPVYKLLLCVRYLQTRYLAFICIVSVMLGVATLIVVNAVMSGFSTKLKDRLHGVLSDVVIDTDRMDGFVKYDNQGRPVFDHNGKWSGSRRTR